MPEDFDDGDLIEKEEVETVVGYIYTHCDCPSCNEDNFFEGDRTLEEVNCVYCNTVFNISHVM